MLHTLRWFWGFFKSLLIFVIFLDCKNELLANSYIFHKVIGVVGVEKSIESLIHNLWLWLFFQKAAVT